MDNVIEINGITKKYKGFTLGEIEAAVPSDDRLPCEQRRLRSSEEYRGFYGDWI